MKYHMILQMFLQGKKILFKMYSKLINGLIIRQKDITEFILS